MNRVSSLIALKGGVLPLLRDSCVTFSVRAAPVARAGVRMAALALPAYLTVTWFAWPALVTPWRYRMCTLGLYSGPSPSDQEGGAA